MDRLHSDAKVLLMSPGGAVRRYQSGKRAIVGYVGSVCLLTFKEGALHGAIRHLTLYRSAEE
jgi:hypothetical protein